MRFNRQGDHNLRPAPWTADFGRTRLDARRYARFVRPPESRLRVATLLTTDAVASTPQQIRLGDHRSEELRRERDALVSAEVERLHGTVIKSTGDGTMAAFSAASEAIGCAISVQRTISRRNATATERVDLRIGLATGELVFEAADVFGRAAIESSRICDRAGAGEILVCGLTRRLAAPRSTWPTEAVGELVLKGFDAPVPVFRVGWGEVVEPVIPLPAAMTARRSDFVGRESTIAAMVQMWNASVVEKSLQMLVIGGEPGIGKSSVLARVAGEVFRTGGSVLYGRCRGEQLDSLRPIRDALSHYVVSRPQHLSEELGGGVADLARLVPELADRVPPSVAEQTSDRRGDTAAVLDAIVQWLMAASRVRPVALFIDDAEWLDRQSGELIRRLWDEPGVGPILVVVAHRDREALATGELSRALSHLRESVHTIRLQGLTSDETSELVATRRPVGDDIVRRLHRDSGGNPLYLLELIRDAESGEAAEPERVPRDAAQLVLRRVDRLGQPVGELLEVATVLGHEFTLTALERVLAWPPDDTYKVLDLVVRDELLRETNDHGLRVEFTHAIVREAIYGRLTNVRRARLHRGAAIALEELADSGWPIAPTELAHHYVEAASTGEIEPALKWCKRAAADATERMAHDEAGGWLDRALELCEAHRKERTASYRDLLVARAIASQSAGQRGIRARFLHAATVAKQHGDQRKVVEIALSFDRGFFERIGQADELRIELLREALLLDVSPAERACLIALLASELAWDDPDEVRFELSDEALELARECGDQRALLRVLSLRTMTLWCPDRLTDVAETVDELGALAEAIDDPIPKALYLMSRFGVDVEAGLFARLPDTVSRLEELARFLRLPDVQWHAALLGANLALMEGRLGDAETAANATLTARKDARRFETLVCYAAIAFEVRRLSTGLDDVVQQLEMWRGRPADGGYSVSRLLYDAGRPNAAHEDYARVVSKTWEVPRTVHGGMCAVNLAYLAARYEDKRTASHLMASLEPYGDRFFHGIKTYHVGNHYRAMLASALGRYDEAAALFERAVAKQDAVGAPLLAAESRLEWARLSLLDETLRRPDPRALVDVAVTAADAAGATALSGHGREIRDRL
jgi:class 3 adenylate cyclase